MLIHNLLITNDPREKNPNSRKLVIVNTENIRGDDAPPPQLIK